MTSKLAISLISYHMTIKRKSSSGLPTAFARQRPEISSRVLWNYQKHQLIIRLPHSISDNSVMNTATTYPLYWPSWQFYAEGSTQLPRMGSIPLVNRLRQNLAGFPYKEGRCPRLSFLLANVCGQDVRGAATDKLLMAACVWCLLTSNCDAPGSLWLQISRAKLCIAITYTREFFQELLNKRETFLGSTKQRGLL